METPHQHQIPGETVQVTILRQMGDAGSEGKSMKETKVTANER